MADTFALKVAYGNKDDIETAKTESKIDKGDFVVTKDTDELAFINKDNETKFLKSKSSKEYTLNGTDLGALSNGSKIPSGIDMDGLLGLITQKPLHPSYVDPTVSIAKSGAGSNAGAVEAGTSVTPILTATFNKNDAGNLTKLAILKGTEEVGSDTASPYTYTGAALVIGDETVTYKAQATYADGPVKDNNLGTPDATGQIKAGTVSSNNFSFTGQRNLFYGTGVGSVPELDSDTIRGLTGKKLNPTQGYIFNISVAVGQQYVIIAYPATLRDINQIKYVEGNDPNLANNFAKSTVQVADARGGSNGLMNYKCYALGLSTPAQAVMTLTVTI